MRLRSLQCACWSGALGLALFAGTAHAQSTKGAKAAAIQLFDDGRKLAQSGAYADACPKFEQAEKLVPGLGTEFNLADCYEHIGRIASAWIGFREVASGALAVGQSDREGEAKRRASLLEPKLMRLKLTIAPSAPADLVIERDGEPMAKALWSSAIPVDPGKHVFTAHAAGKQSWEKTITLDAPGTTQSVEIPTLADGPPQDASHSAGPLPPDTSPAQSSPRPWQVPLGVALGVVGVAGITVGVITALKAKSGNADSNADGHCVGNACDPTGTDLRNNAVTMGNIATVGFIAGAAFAAGGIALVVMAPSASKPASSASLRMGVGPGSISAMGTW